MNVISGELNGSDHKVAVITTRWNEFITSRLLDGALGTLRSLGVSENSITVIHIPGAFEIGPAAKKAAASGKFDSVICLGCVIRGATGHYEHVAGQAARLIAQASYDTGIPVIFGVLTTETVDQAIDRAGAKAGNKGSEAASTAVEMVNLYRRLFS